MHVLAAARGGSFPMHTPIKHALGILAIAVSLAATLPSTVALDPNDLGRAFGHHTIGGGNVLDETFNACDGDEGTPLTADQGLFNSCVAIFGSGAYCTTPAGTFSTPTTPSPDCEYAGEAGMPYRIVANGDSTGSWTTKASGLELFACFYDGAGAQLECNDGAYDGLGDLVGTVPAGAALMLVGSGLGTAEVSWWFGCDDFAYTLTYGGTYCA